MADERATWNLNDLLNGRKPEELIKEAEEKLTMFVKSKEELSPRMKPERLLELIKLKEDIIMLIAAVETYYELRFYENTKDSEALAKMTKYQQFSTHASNEMLFFSLWFMSLKDEEAQRFITAPALREYTYYLELIRKQKPYTKTEEIERILALKSMTSGAAFADVYSVFTNGFTYEFKNKKGLTAEEIRKYVHSKQPAEREEAYTTLLTRYQENSVVLSEMYKNIVLDWYNEGVKIRGYKSPLSIRDAHNDIDDEAVRALLNVVRKNSKVFTEYFKLKYEINKARGEHYPYSRYHLYAPLAVEEEKTYSYEEAKKITLETYKAFDERFYEAAKSIFEAQHVHSHPQPNKRGGAFCEYLGRRTKPYILLNHTGTLRDVFTMMHEFGHGIHGIFAEQQPDLLHHAALPMAETASIFGEMLLAKKLLRESTSNEEKMIIIAHNLDDRYASIGRQAYFVLFEEQAHKMIVEGATKEELDEAYYNLLKEQFGDMEVPELFKHEWNYIPHIHETPFYCYAYAWGNLLVLSLFSLYEEEGASFIEKYVKLLSAGGSKSPQALLAELGINPKDESFWERGFDIIKKEIEELRAIATTSAQ